MALVAFQVLNAKMHLVNNGIYISSFGCVPSDVEVQSDHVRLTQTSPGINRVDGINCGNASKPACKVWNAAGRIVPLSAAHDAPPTAYECSPDTRSFSRVLLSSCCDHARAAKSVLSHKRLNPNATLCGSTLLTVRMLVWFQGSCACRDQYPALAISCLLSSKPRSQRSITITSGQKAMHSNHCPYVHTAAALSTLATESEPLTNVFSEQPSTRLASRPITGTKGYHPHSFTPS